MLPRRSPIQRTPLLAVVCLALLLAGSAEAKPLRPLPACDEPVTRPLSVIHFFDWYADTEINGPGWTHKVDWGAFGLREEEVGRSVRYYDSQLSLIAQLGLDGIVLEWYGDDASAGTALTPALLSAARANGLDIGLFYDWEIQQVGGIGPVISETPYIRPSVAQAESLAAAMVGFYRSLPDDLWLLDRQGRVPIMLYGLGFDRAVEDREAWQHFYLTLLLRLEEGLDRRPVVYWSAASAVQLEYAFQQFPDRIRPYNFVLDSPQHQLAPGAVTWNVNFDNLGVWRVYRLEREIRNDPRYLKEMLWLAKHTAPELLFIYGWNEFFEGANVMPDTTYGSRRYELVRAMLAEVRERASHRLPCTLLVVDDLAEAWLPDGGRIRLEGSFLRYPMRRLVPQSDVVLASEVTPELLRRYGLIVSLAQRAPAALRLLAEAMDERRVVLVGPSVASVPELRARFASRARQVDRFRKVGLIDDAGRQRGRRLVYDDVLEVTPALGVETFGWIEDRGRRTPVLLRRGDDFWINAFVPDDRLLGPVFEHAYGRPLERGILFGKGARSQHIDVSPTGVVGHHHFSAPAVFEHEALPVAWTTPPPAELP